MLSRRKFLAGSVLATSGFIIKPQLSAAAEKSSPVHGTKGKPIIISTWRHGLPANQVAGAILEKGGRSLDAVEAGVRVPEADPNIMTVGLGGYPDRDGYVTLDACIMDEKGNAGSVTFLQDIVHPVSVARKVMEDTPHVMLSGEGALQFALEKGFKKQNLLTDKAREAWEEWKKKSKYDPVINIENHDTISMLAIDAHGDLSGACTTSGAAFKMHGRVGDSPIIGAGLFCDNEVGGAASTGMGELVMKTVGSFLVVELMRNGMSPQQACEAAVHRIAEKIPGYEKFQIGYIAINKAGETGAYCIHPGFNYALWQEGQNTLTDARSLFRK